MNRIALLLFLFCLPSCTNCVTKKYHVEDFKTIAIKKQLSGTYGCTDEKEAIKIVGAYIFATFQESRFPTDYQKWGDIVNFFPVCVRAQDIDSVFTFSNFVPGGFSDVPCSIDVKFKKKTLRFCFVNIVFDPNKIALFGCPDHPKSIVEKYQKECE